MNCARFRPSNGGDRRRGYALIECLVYIGVLFTLLGVGYAALYRCIQNSVNLRRSADDLTRTLHIGELWRADVRSARGGIRIETVAGEPILHLAAPSGGVDYRFSENTLYRRAIDGPWTGLLESVKSCSFTLDERRYGSCWKCELELKPRSKAGSIKPLFTFIAVPGQGGSPR